MVELLGVANVRDGKELMRTTCLLILLATAAGAHEIGTTRVAVLFQQGQTYNIEIVTDATALADKLEASTGGSLPANTSVAGFQTLFTNFDGRFRQRVKMTFDDQAVHPAITYSVAPPVDATSATSVSIRLTGQIPPRAKSFTWNFGWTFASYAMTIRNASSENPSTQWLEGGMSSNPFALASAPSPANRLETAKRYLALGFTHIVPLGLDHMLFVLGIYLLSRRARSVLMQVSAFTIAHSITLGLSMYGVISVSPRIVEPMIAISIAYVAIENIFLAELKSWRVALVFAFGLLHGMGFAGALKELGLPRSEFITALLTFNIGVEAGQLAVIAGAFLLVGWHYSNRAWYRARIVVPASAMIACIAVYWTIARLSL
jgi:hydrogenase/urease accessory protein HupE